MSSPFECQPFSDRDVTATPSIDNSYFDPKNAAELLANGIELITLTVGVTYFFPVRLPSDCRGNVLAINYCYRNPQSRSRHDIFEFLSLKQDGLHLSVEQSFPVRNKPRNKTCTAVPSSSRDEQLVCCVEKTIDQFNVSILSENYSFGLYVQSPLLAFTNSTPEYRVKQFRDNNSPPGIGENVTLEADQLITGPLLLLRLIIGKAMSICSMQSVQTRILSVDHLGLTLD